MKILGVKENVVSHRKHGWFHLSLCADTWNTSLLRKKNDIKSQNVNAKCKNFCFSSLRPVVVEQFEQQDDVDGYPDKTLPRKNPEFFKAREIGPRFAQLGSFEHEYGTRWKQLHELYKQKEEALKREMAMEEEKLEAQMEFARYEHETELLRERMYFNINI